MSGEWPLQSSGLLLDVVSAHFNDGVMKKLLFALFSLTSLLACHSLPEELESEQMTDIEFEVTDICEDDAKASYDPDQHKTKWTAGDEIGCYAEMCNNVRFTNSATNPSTFTGQVLGTPDQYYFYFPYQQAAVKPAGSMEVSMTHPSQQTLVAGGYSVNPPMAAQSSLEKLADGVTFRNAGGLLKFNVTSDVERTLTKVEFSGNNGEIIAGTYTIDISSSVPSMKMDSGGESLITMTGSVHMTANVVYSFIVVLPPTTFANGFNIKLMDADGYSVTHDYDNGSITIGRGKSINLQNNIEFNTESQESQTVLEIKSMTSGDIVFTISEENLTVTASKAGYVDPTSLQLAMSYTATHDGQIVTPTIVLNQAGSLSGSTISKPSSFTADLTMPRTITLSYGDESKTYEVKLSQLTDTGLPVVYVNTPNAQEITSKDDWLPEEPDDDQVDEYYSYIYIDAEGRKSWDGVAFEELASSKCYVKGRGNTTWNWDKKPYAIKLDKKSAVLGMSKHKRWVLLANKIDKSMIRNKVTFMIASACYNDGSGSQQGWNPTGHSVELVLNGQHLGNYLLCEQIKIDENRINITESDTPETSEGDQGYLLEGDRYWGNDPTETLYWESYRKQTGYAQLYNRSYTYMYGTNYYDGGAQANSGNYKFKWGLKGPDDGDLGSNAVGKATAAYKFINEKVTTVEEFIFNTMTTSTPLSTIAQYIHVDSFINYWLVFEMAMNQELNNPGSVYMYYDNNDGLIHAGPVWDFDWGTFNYDFTDDGLYNDKSNHFIAANSLWYCRLLQNTAFQNRVLERWTVIEPLLITLTGKIPTLSEYLSVSAGYNWDMWTTTTSDHGDPNSEKNMTYSNATKRISDNATQRISDLNVLISNKRYN